MRSYATQGCLFSIQPWNYRHSLSEVHWLPLVIAITTPIYVFRHPFSLSLSLLSAPPFSAANVSIVFSVFKVDRFVERIDSSRFYSPLVFFHLAPRTRHPSEGRDQSIDWARCDGTGVESRSAFSPILAIMDRKTTDTRIRKCFTRARYT